MTSFFSRFLMLVKYEILITMRQAFSWSTPLLFFIIVVCLFPLALGPDKTLLNQIAPGIIWVAILLATLISIGNLFRQDDQEGFLDLMLTSSTPLTLLVLGKILAHWITHSLPLICISPLLGYLFDLQPQQVITLIMTLLLGTPILSLLGAVGAALTVGLRGHGLLLPVLIMPLYIPVLIFGTGIMIASQLGQNISGYYAILGAILLISLGFSPWLTAVALKIHK